MTAIQDSSILSSVLSSEELSPRQSNSSTSLMPSKTGNTDSKISDLNVVLTLPNTSTSASAERRPICSRRIATVIPYLLLTIIAVVGGCIGTLLHSKSGDTIADPLLSYNTSSSSGLYPGEHSWNTSTGIFLNADILNKTAISGTSSGSSSGIGDIANSSTALNF